MKKQETSRNKIKRKEREKPVVRKLKTLEKHWWEEGKEWEEVLEGSLVFVGILEYARAAVWEAMAAAKLN